MSPDRQKIAIQVLRGELPESELSDFEIIEIQETVMRLIIKKKMGESEMVFCEVEGGMLN